MKPLTTSTFTKTFGLKHGGSLGREDLKTIQSQAYDFADSFASNPNVETSVHGKSYVFTRMAGSKLERLYVEKGDRIGESFFASRDSGIEFTTSQIRDGRKYPVSQFSVKIETAAEAFDFDREGGCKKKAVLYPLNALERSNFHSRQAQPVSAKRYEISAERYATLEQEMRQREQAARYASWKSERHLLPPIPDAGYGE